MSLAQSEFAQSLRWMISPSSQLPDDTRFQTRKRISEAIHGGPFIRREQDGGGDDYDDGDDDDDADADAAGGIFPMPVRVARPGPFHN